ncbi:MAG: ATP-dependent RecD-like DNA helicase [Lachnospiraceae bacterium]|nr:ATP-dependent RecD-like DNA helicase [Lachnospiraceae bacterium]
MESISGYIDHIIYHNDENGYTVFVMRPDSEVNEDALNGEDDLTCVGSFFGIAQGEHIRLEGDYREHKSYGMQFSASAYEVILPQDSEAVLRYLSSGAIKGIGPVLAKKIVDRFGDETFHIMETRPEKLAEIRGISESKAMDISDQVMDRRDQRSAMLLLSSYGIGSTLSMRIFKQYGRDLGRVLEENPYRLAEEVDGVGFKIADAIAAKNGFAIDSDFRIQCGVLYVLSQMAGNGHTYLPGEELARFASDLLGVEPSDIEAMIPEMVLDKKLVTKGGDIYLPPYYRAEAGTAKLLLALDEEYDTNRPEIDKVIAEAERDEGWQLDDVQRHAVHEAAAHGIFVLTGGPGTGKTTTIRTMLRFFTEQGLDISLCAPTGRAAKRMSEATGYPAQTIHRLLGLGGGKDSDERDSGSANDMQKKDAISYNATHPLESDVVIVDEVSMVDILLMYALVKATPVGARLILVGDANQLPSVGPGNVLKDIIHSRAFSVVTLERIFRQGNQSDIVENAHSINRGEHVSLNNKSSDFFFAKSRDADKIIAKTCAYLKPDSLPAYVGAEVFDVQVLTPTRKGNLGVERLNSILQKYLNPPSPDKAELESGNRIFRVGDKVMQIKNNYDITWEIRGKYGIAVDSGDGIFNGDIGIVTDIDLYGKTATIVFDDNRTAEYPFQQLDEIEHAYAVTIHKSQGSEYPAIIIPLLPGPRLLYNRNLLYTAITRAKKCVVIIGDGDTFNNMIDNATESRRYSGLKTRLEELVGQ